ALERAPHRVLERHRVELQAAGMSDLEQILDDPVEALDLAEDELEVLALRALGPERAGQILDPGADPGERVADLVRDAGGEAPQRGEAVEPASVLLGALEWREVHERGDRAVDAAALVAQERGGEA